MRTTVNIPDSIAEEADTLISKCGIATRNQFIVEALENWIKLKKEELIDNEFAMMATDTSYQLETEAIESEFEESDREVIRLTDD